MSAGNGPYLPPEFDGELRKSRRGAQLLAERVALRLRRHQLKCTTVQVSLRSPEFKTIQRQKGTPAPTNVSRVIFQCVVELLEGTWNWSAPLRAMTITAAGLVPEEEAGAAGPLPAPCGGANREKLSDHGCPPGPIRPPCHRLCSRQTQTARDRRGRDWKTKGVNQ